ncbi:MAG: hypothetical protein WAX04_14125 [Oscillospiraceae bacterium]
MKNKIILGITILVIMFLCFLWSTNKSGQVSEIGMWRMETISNYNGELFATNFDFVDFDGEKFDLKCEFKKGKTFFITNGTNKNYSGTYSKENAQNAISLSLEFENGELAKAVVGKREYYDGKTVDSLILTTNDKIIVFLKEIGDLGYSNQL